MSFAFRMSVLLACVTVTAAAAQAPSLDDVLSRLHAYLDRYEQTLAAVVSPFTSRSSFNFRIEPAPIKPMPVTIPWMTRDKPSEFIP